MNTVPPPCATTLLLAAVCALHSTSVSAQEALGLDAPVQGTLAPTDTTLTSGQIATLVPLDVPPGTRLELALESGDFDAYLALVEVQEGEIVRYVVQNDDHPGLTSSTDALTRYVPQEGVDYAAWVGSYDGSGSGSFTLTASTAEAGEVFPIPVEWGEWMEESLDDDDARSDDGDPMEVFEFDAVALERVMALAEGEASPDLQVVDPSTGRVLVRESADDGSTFLDWLAPAEGRYRLQVTPGEDRRGRFALRLWSPPVTAAELAGLQLDSAVHHPEYGFRLPSPGPGFQPSRGVASPHNSYRDGFSRAWYLSDLDQTVVVILYASYFGTLTDAVFDQLVTSFASGFAGALEPRFKEESPRSIRVAIPDGSDVVHMRCIGTPPDAPASDEALCVAVVSPGDAAFAEEILDGMLLR